MLTSYSIRAILHKLYALGRLLKWAIELSKFDIKYRPWLAIKGQILGDFIAKMLDVQSRDLFETLWVPETDISSRAAGGGANMVLQSPKGLSIAKAVKFAFVASNNEA